MIEQSNNKKSVNININIGDFLENEKYIKLLYSKNFKINYKYTDTKISPIYQNKETIVDKYEKKLNDVRKKARTLILINTEKVFNVYNDASYFCGLYKMLSYIKKDNIVHIKNLILYDCSLYSKYYGTIYSQYTDEKLIDVIRKNFNVSYKYNLVFDINNIHNNIIYSPNTLHTIIYSNNLLENYNGVYTSNIIILNFMNIINKMDNSSAIIFICTYVNPVYFDVVNFISKYFENTKMCSLKYFLGQILYVIFSGKKNDFSQKKINKIKSICDNNIVRLYSNDSHIDKHYKFINKVVDNYSEKMDFLINMTKLKYEDDIRYDVVANTIKQHKSQMLKEFMNSNNDDDLKNMPR